MKLKIIKETQIKKGTEKFPLAIKHLETPSEFTETCEHPYNLVIADSKIAGYYRVLKYINTAGESVFETPKNKMHINKKTVDLLYFLYL